MLLNLPTAPIMFFGGKGGVGKTTVANATALKLSPHASTLVVSTDPAHNVGHLWDKKVGDSPTRVRDGIDILELDPARATEEHLKQAGDTMRRMMPEHLHKEVTKHLNLSRQSPGTHEAAMLERIATINDDVTGFKMLRRLRGHLRPHHLRYRAVGAYLSAYGAAGADVGVDGWAFGTTCEIREVFGFGARADPDG